MQIFFICVSPKEITDLVGRYVLKRIENMTFRAELMGQPGKKISNRLTLQFYLELGDGKPTS